MSPEPAAPAELSFGAAYDRLQAVAAELGADATMAPDRLIALLREGKGLERALRDHLERVEQEVRAIEDGDGAVAFRIVDAAARPGVSPTAAGAPAPVPPPPGVPAPSSPAAPVRDEPAPAAEAPARRTPEPARPATPQPQPPAPPTLGFPGADDDIPF